MFSLSLFGLSFHLYGLIVGIAIVIGWQMVEWRWQKALREEKNLQKSIVAGTSLKFKLLIFLVAAASLIGARAWHIATDWNLYREFSWTLFAVWQGGLSIVGAVAGGLIGLGFSTFLLFRKHQKQVALYCLDLLMFGLPFAQAFGRLGNWVNQELYGLPTNLPWKIFIDPQHRLLEFQNQAFYHPLFAYEAIATTLFGLGLWWNFWKTKKTAGSGKIAAYYVLYYSVVRFFLDFLRVQKTTVLAVADLNIGFNQMILLVVAVTLCWWLSNLYQKKIAVWIVATAAVVLSSWGWLTTGQKLPLDPDEVVWVLDSEAFEWYSQGQWQQFMVNDSAISSNWSSHQYRVIDQPQLGKYILGGIVSITNQKPWESKQKSVYYQQFESNNLNITLSELDAPVSQAIIFLRQIASVVSLLAFGVISILFVKVVNKTWAGVLLYLLLTQNQVVATYYRLANVSVYSFIFQVAALSMIIFSWKKIQPRISAQTKTWKIVAYGLVSGGLVAAATSIKLDGAFLLFSPFLLLWWLAATNYKSVSDQKQQDFLTRSTLWILSFLISLGIIFFLLEPVLWQNVFDGMYVIFGSRLLQQERFYSEFGKLSFLQMLHYSWQLALTSFSNQIVEKIALLVLIISILYRVAFSNKPLPIYSKTAQNWSFSLIIAMLPLILGSCIYGRVGFDRYFLPIIIWYYVAGLVLATGVLHADKKDNNKKKPK